MSDYELLMIVFTVMGILVAVLIEYIKKPANKNQVLVGRFFFGAF